MNRLQTLLDRMPRHFALESDSVNYKLLSIIAENSEINHTVYQTILKYWDIDQSVGIALDRRGKDEGISRGSWSDDEYRKMIKVQCILNLSEADINTINSILDAYMGNTFVGVQDGWDIYKSASILVNVRQTIKSFPRELMQRIKSAGVGYCVLLDELMNFMVLQGKTYSFFTSYKITGRFRCVGIDGVFANSNVSVNENAYEFSVDLPIIGRFGTTSVKGSVEVSTIDSFSGAYSAPIIRRRCGNFRAGGA